MVSPSESSEANPEGGRPAPDPLASPTLAALYASQGHTDVAEGIYAQLRGQPLPGARAAVETLLQRLLSLREAARQVRNAGTRARSMGD
jgi:hypothetical protein